MCNSDYAGEAQHYVIRTLPVLFGLITRLSLDLKHIFLQSLGNLSDDTAGLCVSYAYSCITVFLYIFTVSASS